MRWRGISSAVCDLRDRTKRARAPSSDHDTRQSPRLNGSTQSHGHPAANSRSMPDLPVGQLVRKITPQLTDEEMAAYDAPFPDSRFKAGARTFPELAMVEPGMEGVAESVAALKFWGEDWSGQSFMAIGAKAPDAETMYTLRS